MVASPESISFFAETNGRPPHKQFGIKQDDRFSHVYVIGRTGAGKTTLLETLALQDIQRGRKLCVIDPHGDLAERLVSAVPGQRLDDLRYMNVPDPAQPYGYNPLRRVHTSRIPLAVSGIMEAFKKLWDIRYAQDGLLKMTTAEVSMLAQALRNIMRGASFIIDQS